MPAAALLIYGLMQRKAIAEEIASGKYRRRGMLLSFMILIASFALIWYFRPHGLDAVFARGEQEDRLHPELLEPRPERPDPNGAYEPELAWIPLLVVVGLIAIGIGFYVLAARRRAQTLGSGRSGLAGEVADVLDDSLDDLRAEPDARRAVIAAYARLEHTFAASGLARLRQETTEEYVGRILGKLEVDARLVRRLTDLFTRAKFSQHAVDETMKQEAIDALAQIRDDLRAAARRQVEERTQQLARQAAPS